MRLAELDGARVVDRAGRRLGVVREVHCADGEITHLGIGTATLLRRFTGGGGGRRVPWSSVARIRKGTLVIDEG
jgi:sporulation protein YlmC with PRC-barrel domain